MLYSCLRSVISTTWCGICHTPWHCGCWTTRVCHLQWPWYCSGVKLTDWRFGGQFCRCIETSYLPMYNTHTIYIYITINWWPTVCIIHSCWHPGMSQSKMFLQISTCSRRSRELACAKTSSLFTLSFRLSTGKKIGEKTPSFLGIQKICSSH